MSRVSIITPFKATTPQHIDWLIDAAKSVQAQTFEDWEWVLVNDNSPTDLTLLKEFLKTMPKGKVHTRKSQGKGVSSARNAAAYAAQSELLMPLDADDILPNDALEFMVKAWDLEGSKHGIVYGDVLLFGTDWQKMQVFDDYDFNSLLRRLFMLVGSLHRKSDWERVGGWKSAMEFGLEDWEYWIALGELGVCGYHIPHTTYQYRKHDQGRLAALKKQKGAFAKASAMLRDLHRETFAGRLPVGCCGKTKASPAPSRVPARQPIPLAGDMSFAATAAELPDRQRVVYVGKRNGGFFVTGRFTGTKYKVRGPGNAITTMDGDEGVFVPDVKFVTSLGRDFVVRAK